jgi:hypothetical protein
MKNPSVRLLSASCLVAQFFVSTCLLQAASPKHAVHPVQTTLCDVARNPKQFNHKVVTFQAQYLMTGVEGTWLEDHNCSDVNIAADVPVDVKGGDILRDAYQKGFLGTSDKVITATWVGRFSWQPGKVPTRILSVYEVKDVSAVWK